MSEAKKAAFSYKGYQVREFSFKEPEDVSVDTFSISFNPSGSYKPASGVFTVYFDFRAFIKGNDSEKDVVSAKVSAEFQFTDALALSEIPPYFYKNSIAIAFPYLRAFISTLTFQANVKPLILPVLNLTDLEQPLKENTIVDQ